MYKIPANTLFIGKNLIFVPECHSTNTLAIEKSTSADIMEGAVVITDNQTAGRGQRGNTWLSLPGMNLTFSVILRPVFLALTDQFYLNIIIAMAVRDFLQTKTDAEINVKWPNDVLAGGKKLCGILIENQLKGNKFSNTIAGIGLNMNQQNFDLPTATSLSVVAGRYFDLAESLEQLLSKVEARYLELVSGKKEKLMADYLEALYWRNTPHKFSSKGETFQGVIRDVDEVGRLRIETRGEASEVRLFAEKEIAYVE